MAENNKEQLDLFVKYCKEHPEERFWQALRNWANVDAIYKTTSAGKGCRVIYGDMPVYIIDTHNE